MNLTGVISTFYRQGEYFRITLKAEGVNPGQERSNVEVVWTIHSRYAENLRVGQRFTISIEEASINTAPYR